MSNVNKQVENALRKTVLTGLGVLATGFLVVGGTSYLIYKKIKDGETE